MNRYAAAGIRADAIAGKHVLVLTHDDREARAIVDMPALNDGATRIVRAPGAHGILFHAGDSVLVRSYRAEIRGRDLDVIYLDTDVDRSLTLTQWESIRAALHARDGELIRA